MLRSGLAFLALALTPGAPASPGAGLDLHLVLRADTRDRQVVERCRDVIRLRLQEFGIRKPELSITSAGEIDVTVPGVEDPKRLRHLITASARLELRFVRYPREGGGADSRESIQEMYQGDWSEVEVLEGNLPGEQGADPRTVYYLVERKPVLTGDDLASVRSGQGQLDNPVVLLRLSPEAAKRFGDATAANIGRSLAIVLDGRVVSAPQINTRIEDSAMIQGSFTKEEVEDLVTVLRSRALPARLTVIEERLEKPSPERLRGAARARLMGYVFLALIAAVVLAAVAGGFYFRSKGRQA